MTATKTSLAWQGFRHSNLVSTSAPAQARNGYTDDSDGAEEDGFVGADSNDSQEMMMEIMDKYVQAGEALAEKENDVRQLMKQVDELKGQKSDLENRTAQLTEANEKLADSEGRWYSLAMELEDQMGVIKKGETYTLFQDKVDEAEARLEVATEASNVNRKRLYEIYGVLSDTLEASSTSEGASTVDEHHLQATILTQLRHLKSSLKDMQDARVAAQDQHAAAMEKMKIKAQAEEDARASIQKELEKLREETESRDAASHSQVDELQEALEGVKRSCSEAETRAEAMDKARSKAQESLDVLAGELALERERKRHLLSTLADTRAALESSQQEVNEVMNLKRLVQEAAEASARQSADRLVELEAHLQEAHSQSLKIERDSRQQISDLSVRGRCEVDTANAHAAAQESQLVESLKRVEELEDAIQVVRALLEEKNAAFMEAKKDANAEIDQMRDALQVADENARVTAEKCSGAVEVLRHELERTSSEVNRLQAALEIAQAGASTGQQFAAQVDVMRFELERANAAVDALRLESQKANAEVDALRLDLERTAGEADVLRLESKRANSEVSAARGQALLQTKELREMDRAREAASVDRQRQAAHVRSLEQEIEIVKERFSAAELQHAAQMEDLRSELHGARAQAEDAQQNHNAEIEKLRRELDNASARALTAHDSAARAEELREELKRVSATAQESAALLRQELDNAQAAILAAHQDAKDSKEARVEAEGTFAVALAKVSKAKEEALRAHDFRLSEIKQALEKSVQQTQKLSQHVRNLEARLAEAKSFGKEAKMEEQRLRTALHGSEERVADLGRSLMATRVELDGKTEEVAKLMEVSVANEAAPSAGHEIANTEGKEGANVLHGPQIVDLDHHTSNGGTASAVVANGGSSASGSAILHTCSNSSQSAELEQLQAHAEAMELELRCTIESFDGQLNAMAREKLAIQKQVKELTGQCTTLRKQVSHYKKQAKESEAHVEQIMELQYQLCATEATADSLRDTNSELKLKIDMLEADKSEVSKLRARLEELEKLHEAKQKELAAKTQDAESAIARSDELKRQLEGATFELSSVKKAFAAMENGLETGRTRVSKLEAFVGEMENEKQHLKDVAEACRAEVKEARSKYREVEESVRSLRQEKDTLVCAAQRADEERARLLAQLREIEMLTFAGWKGEEGAGRSTSTVKEEITTLRERLSAAENLLEETARALKETGLEQGNGEFKLETGTTWVMNGIRNLQRRLQIAESNLRDSTEAQERSGYALKAQKEPSSILECDGNMAIHKDEQDNLNGDGKENGNGQAGMNGTTMQEKSITKDTDSSLPASTNPVYEARPGEVSEAVSMMSEIQAMLGCKMEEVMVTLEEQQAFVQQQHVKGKVLGEVMQSYLCNMERLASSIAPEAYSRVSPLLAKTSELWSQGAFVATTREGLDLVDEVTKIFTDIIPGALTAESVAYQSALHRAGEEVERLKETMRKERLMMMVFRRWGHFYLALSNEALRKRTKDRNHARTQQRRSHASEPEKTPPVSAKMDQVKDNSPRHASDERNSDGSVSMQRQLSVQPSQEEIQAMMDQEYLQVTRELARQPSSSLLALSGAREEMDATVRKVQATLGSLMSQPPPTFHVTSNQIVEELPQDDQRDESVGSSMQETTALVPREDIDMSEQSVPVALAGRRTTGPLVEDGISKEERARFLREQREQRKANRKKSRPNMKMKSNTNAGPNVPGHDDLVSRRISAPALIPSNSGESPIPEAPGKPIIPPPIAPSVTKREQVTKDNTDPTGTVAPPSEEQNPRRIPSKKVQDRQGTPPEESSAPPTTKVEAPSPSADIATRPAVTFPPPRMFNPTSMAPPTGVPPRAVTSVGQAQRHPTMAFSVNETVERALKEAKRDASLADKKATFWRHRFRDLAVWAASFTILAFAADRSFDNC